MSNTEVTMDELAVGKKLRVRTEDGHLYTIERCEDGCISTDTGGALRLPHPMSPELHGSAGASDVSRILFGGDQLKRTSSVLVWVCKFALTTFMRGRVITLST